MSTVIVRIYTNEGFVIASDGRKTRSEDQSILSDSAQKVFQAQSQANVIAYAIAGVAQLNPEGSDEVVFDFVAEAEKAAGSIAFRKCKNLLGYAVRLCKPIYESLLDGYVSGRIPSLTADPKSRPGQKGHTIASFFLAGFYDGVASHVCARFYTIDGKLADPEVLPYLIEPGKAVVYGPREIYYLMFETEDPRLSAYRRPKRRYDEIDLAEAIEISKNYICACADPALCKFDGCSGVGGRVQIATITPAGGFQWVPDFGPA